MSKSRLWTGRIMWLIVVLFMAFDGITHTLALQFVKDAFVQLGYPMSVVVPIGLTALVSIILYAIPRTSVLGALLLTAYLGGAVATNVRLEMPLTYILFPVFVGILTWGALYLLDPRIAALIPFKNKNII